MNTPKYVEVDGIKYAINTDFRVAIKCEQIANDLTISDYERPLAIIYLLFGDKGLDECNNYEKLFELAKKYLACGKEVVEEDYEQKEPDMDFIEDMPYIEASFMSDYHIDLENEKMDWWKFMKLMNGLSNSEFGNCCVLNNIRNLRNIDVSKIENDKERNKIIEAQKRVALKRNQKHFTKEEEDNIDEFNKIAGI